MKITLVLLTAYAIVGAFHSCREFYRGRKSFPEAQHRHHWFMCGLTWLPTSIVFPFMSPPFGGSARIWRRENLKELGHSAMSAPLSDLPESGHARAGETMCR